MNSRTDQEIKVETDGEKSIRMVIVIVNSVAEVIGSGFTYHPIRMMSQLK